MQVPKSTKAVAALRDRTGQVLVLFALALPVTLGFCAITIDFGNLFAQKRALQKTADAATLAGAQKLPCGDPLDPDPLVMAAAVLCRAKAGALASTYNVANGGEPLHECTGPSDSNCYEFIDRDKIRVRLTRPVTTFFGGIFGHSSWDVHAKARAIWMRHVETIPGSTVTNPDITNPPSTTTTPASTNPPTTTTTPGTTNPAITTVSTVTTPGSSSPALLFAGSPSCSPPAIDLQGNGSEYDGAVISNGRIDAPANNVGGGALVYANPPNCAPTLGNNPSWGPQIVQAPAPWPVPPLFCTTATSAPGVNACNPTTAAANGQITTVGGVPCTAKPADWAIGNVAPAPGLYCASHSITVTHSFTNVGLVAPLITISGSNNVVSGTSLLPAYGGLLFYAYGNGGGPGSAPTSTSVVNQSGSGFAFAGAIFAPFGKVDLNASGTQASCPDPTAGGCGFIQAWMIRLNGANKTFQGLGPGTSGPPTVTTTTTTIPGSTNPATTTTIPGSTNPATTTTIPGSTTPGSTVTNPDVVTIVGTGSGLDE